MKNLLLVLILFTTFSCNTSKHLKVPAKTLEKDGYELKMEFKENSEYVTEVLQITNTVMTIPEMPEQKTSATTTTKTTLKTGPMLNKQCDVLITYDEMDMQVSGAGTGQVETPELVGMKIYGKLTEGIQSIDSIVGGDPAIHTMLQNLLEPIFSNMQIDFPNPMKIGQEFLDTKVTEIPIEGMGSTYIKTETNYTLVNVNNDIADLTSQVKLTGMISIMEDEFPLNGTGTGTMSLDLKQNYSPSSSTSIDQEVNMEIRGISMNQKVSMSINTKTQIVK